MSVNIDRLIAIIEKYRLIEPVTILMAKKAQLDNPNYTIGIIGDNFCVPKCLGLMFPPLKKHVSSRESFCIEIAKGVGAELVTEGNKIFIDDPALDGLRIIATDSTRDFEDIDLPEFLLEIDSCFVVMSAQRILSNAERQLIRNGLQDAPREYLLTNFIDLEEEDQAEVLNLLKKFDPSREIMPIDNQDNVDALKNHWTTSTPDVKKLSNLREEAAIRYARAKLTAHLTERRAVCEIAKKNAAPLIRDLSYVPQDIPSKQRDTTFLLKRFSDRIKMDTQTELDNFELKMREDLKVGIEEENNIEDLRQTLPAFVGGSWQEFVSDTLMHKMIDRENELMTLLEKDISDKIDEILKRRLTAENYIKINSIIDAEIRRIPEGLLVDKASGGSWNDMEFRLSHVKNKNSVRGLMSGVLVAAGGFAVMSSIFLPGMALMLISYKMHKNNSNEQKAQLLEGALEFSKRHYLSLTAELEQAFKSASALVEERIAKCYEKIFELLTNVLEEYKENVSQLEAELVELERDCENLSVDK